MRSGDSGYSADAYAHEGGALVRATARGPHRRALTRAVVLTRRGLHRAKRRTAASHGSRRCGAGERGGVGVERGRSRAHVGLPARAARGRKRGAKPTASHRSPARDAAHSLTARARTCLRGPDRNSRRRSGAQQRCGARAGRACVRKWATPRRRHVRAAAQNLACVRAPELTPGMSAASPAKAPPRRRRRGTRRAPCAAAQRPCASARPARTGPRPRESR